MEIPFCLSAKAAMAAKATTSEEGLVFPLGPHVSYKPKSVVMERKFKDEVTERLVKWKLIKPASSRDTGQKIPPEQKKTLQHAHKRICIWMREDEMKSCCPSLLKSSSPEMDEGDDSSYGGERTPYYCSPASSPEPGSALKQFEAALEAKKLIPTLDSDETVREMKEDIRNLVKRAKMLYSREVGGGGGSSMVLASTIAILNTYAKMKSLASVFQEFDAVDLLLNLLESRDPDVRKNASDMLHSLTDVDKSIHSYVLLHLIKSTEGPGASLQSRQMLLDLFSETASSLKNDLKGVIFPQVGH